MLKKTNVKLSFIETGEFCRPRIFGLSMIILSCGMMGANVQSGFVGSVLW